jgi:hypothetical protein
MSTGKMGNWLQIGANLGIILGLILVGFQLKQNSDLLKVQLLYEESQSFISHERQMIGENGSVVWTKSLEDPKSLTLAEIRVMDGYLYGMTEQWRASQLLNELGILDEEWKDRLTEEAAFYLGSPFGRAWWEVYQGDVDLPPEMFAIIEEALNASPDFTLTYVEEVRKALSAQDD